MAEIQVDAVDAKLFREVMGSFATGVTVVTTETHGEIRGMTANAFMSGSLKPPLCIISVAKAAHMHGFLAHAQHFGVSILAEGQQRLSTHFAGRHDADLRPVFEYLGRTPVVSSAVATASADIVAVHDSGDHSLFIGRIVGLRNHDKKPLLVHRGRYASLTYTSDPAAIAVTDFW